MNISNRGGLGLQLQFLLISAIGIACSLGKIQEEEGSEGEFSYDNNGDDWTGMCRVGSQQSPIAIEDNDVVKKYIPRIHFHNYDSLLHTPLTVVNSGHTVSMNIARSDITAAKIRGGLLRGEFEAQSVHFHWGSANSKGSEHTINHERYDAEMHIVHKNIRYADKSVGEASMHSDGLAVLAVMIKAVPTVLSARTGLNKIFNILPKIVKYQSNATIDGRLSVSDLLNDIETEEFYSYEGSLTTPDCAESVIWTVFKEVIHCPERQISKLWHLQDSRRRPLINNYRKLQDINDRLVFYRPIYRDILTDWTQNIFNTFG